MLLKLYQIEILMSSNHLLIAALIEIEILSRFNTVAKLTWRPGSKKNSLLLYASYVHL